MQGEPTNTTGSSCGARKAASAAPTRPASPSQLLAQIFWNIKLFLPVQQGTASKPVHCAVLGCMGHLGLFRTQWPDCWSVYHIFIALLRSSSFNILFSIYSVIFCPPFKNHLREKQVWLYSGNIFWIVFCSWIQTSSKMHSGRRAEECLIRERMYDRSLKMGIWSSLGTVRIMLYQTALRTANLRGELITLPTAEVAIFSERSGMNRRNRCNFS